MGNLSFELFLCGVLLVGIMVCEGKNAENGLGSDLRSNLSVFI